MTTPNGLTSLDETSPRASGDSPREEHEDRRTSPDLTGYILSFGTSARTQASSNVAPFPPRPEMLERPRAEVRNAILENLYDDRRQLTRKRRLEQLTEDEEAFFLDLNATIDLWEAEEEAERLQSQDHAIHQLSEIAAQLMALRTNR